jgi:hypothetical protein
MNREHFLADLQPNIRRCAKRRAKQATRYPSDNRNAAAAESLERLARSSPDSISDDIWTDLQGFIGGADYQSPRWADTISEACRAVNFRFWPPNLSVFLDRVMTRLTAPQIGGAL